MLGSVVQRAHVTIAQPRNGVFKLYSKRAPMTFSNLEEALSRAEEVAAREARLLAEAAGSTMTQINLSHLSNHVEHDIDGELFLETRVTATASGRPAIGEQREEAA